MLLNYVLFWMMVAEAMICLVISLPFGQKISQKIIQFLTSRLGGKDSNASMAVTIILALVSILFLSDVSTVYKHHSRDTVLSDGMRIRLLAAQRDMYISGFCLFLFLLLRLVYTSMDKNIRLEKSLGAMKKQAEGASAGYKGLLEENESMKKQLAKVHALLGSIKSNDDNDDDVDDDKKKANVLAKLIEENTYLTTKLETAKHDLKLAENKVEIVKKQAEGQSSAFMKLMDEKTEADKHLQLTKTQQETIAQQQKEISELKNERDALKSQIQDYDFMFAEAKKKAE
uniref:Endoplasmic reticulum transmembrane protein n=1 Tax=Globisporangium ultimum (strain ATCC 200006 / CBS 805.95 / DAOM BR144) TaxID=431595 RepID=K3WFP5_GLOUD